MKQTTTSTHWLLAAFHVEFFLVFGLLLLPLTTQAQEDEDEEEIFEISPFVIAEDSDVGYIASQSMAGGRISSDLRNVGSSIQVVTQEFMEDIGATGIEELLQYTTSTEVAGNLGNFTGVTEGLDGQVNTGGARGNPDGTSRIRGLAAPDRTRNFYKTDIPFDRYNTDRIDINRGANSFLFGLGSPAGLVNNGMARARFQDSGQLEFRVGSGGDRPSFRVSGNVNKVLIEDMVAFRFAYLNDATQYRQQPTYKDDQRFYTTVSIQPFRNSNTVIRSYFETGKVTGNAADTVGPVSNLDTFLNAPNYPRMAFDKVRNARNFNHEEGPNNARNAMEDRNPDGLPLRDIGDPQEIEQSIGVGWGFIWDGTNGTDASGTFNGRIRGADQTNGRANQGPNPFWKPNTFFGRTNHSHIIGHGNLSQIMGEGWAFKGLTDLETFDFSKYNLGWDNDFYTRDFDNFNIALEQVLFNGNAGFELGYDFQTLFRSDYNAFSNGAARLTFDINRDIPIPNDLNYAESGDLSYPMNPNFGRVWIETNANDRESTFDRETYRFTGFVKHNFVDQLDNTLGKILGSHTITSLLDHYTEDERFVPYKLASYGTPDPALHLGPANAKQAFNGARNVRNIVYLGPQQLEAFTDPNFTLNDFIIEPAKYDLRGIEGREFDIIYWDLGDDATPDNFGQGRNDTGNEGFKKGTFIPLSTPNKNHRLQHTEVESVAFNSQSFLFDNLLVVNMGWRSDKVKNNLNTEALPMGFHEIPDIDNPAAWNLVDGFATNREIDSEIFGYGGVLNWPHQLIKLPDGTDVAFHYNETENFVPAATRVDQFRQPLPSPAGLSKDWGVTFFLFDNRVISRFNWYDADLKDATAALGGVFNGSLNRVFNHWGFANRDILAADANGDGVIDQEYIDENRMIEFEDPEETIIISQETDEEVIARVAPNFQDAIGVRAAITPYLTDDLKAARNFRVDVDGTVNVQGAGAIQDTQDIQAKGFEWELVMNPTNAWRVSFNFADTDTILTNIGPRMTELFNDFWLPILDDFGHVDWNNPAGPVTGNTLSEQVNADVLEYLEQKAQEGRPTLEQRQYRINFVTNYRFQEGWLQGFSVGGAARWQSNNSVGFPLIPREDGIVQPDIENPWFNEDVQNYDLTFSYRTRIGRNINWTIQLNIRNLQNLQNDEISTIRRQPDGSIARVRYDPPSQFLLTNTFRF